MAPAPACGSRAEHRAQSLIRLGLKPDKWDILVALAGNPNVGKSTVFNALTGLRQHTGNWPGKTIVRAEGAFAHRGSRVKIVDLPGTYSLQAGSADEEVAREFILFGRPDVTVVVVDATRLERNLNLVLQILDITDRVVVYVNLMDEARRHGIAIDAARLERELGVPVVAGSARSSVGIDALLDAAHGVATGQTRTRPFRLAQQSPDVEEAVASLAEVVDEVFPGVPSSRWVAQRLLNADDAVAAAVRSGELGQLGDDDAGTPPSPAPPESARTQVLETAQRLRWDVPAAFHDTLMERTYAAAHDIAGRAEARGLRKAGFNLDRTLDRLLTNRWLGFPLMLAILAAVFWITIEGANVPSGLLATLLIDATHPTLKAAGDALGLPWWLSGFLFDGVYLATAWVVAVMLPPMAIFFPIFTLLEDFGYLPRVAFNLDALFRKAGAHGKQALTMCMGFGCNAAGVVSTRRHRQSPGTAHRHHHEQLLPLQRALADADPHRLDLHRRPGPGASRRPGVRRGGGRHRRPRHRRHVPGVVVPVEHGTARRGDQLQPGAAALPATARAPDALHLAHRPHPHRAVARGGVRRAGRRRHLALVQRDDRRRQHRRARGRLAESVRPADWPQRRDPARLRGGDPRQRDRHPDRAHAHGPDRRRCGGGHRGRRRG